MEQAFSDEFTYEQVYGCDLGGYLERVGIGFEDMRRIKEAEIAMLKESLRREIELNGTVTRLAELIYTKIEQKKSSLKRHKEWFERSLKRNDSCKLEISEEEPELV